MFLFQLAGMQTMNNVKSGRPDSDLLSPEPGFVPPPLTSSRSNRLETDSSITVHSL